MIKSVIIGLVALVAVAILCSSEVYAKNEDKVELSLEQSYVSRYIWRGQDLYADNQGAYQPSATITFQDVLADDNLSFNIWGSFATSGGYERAEELDYSIYYAPDLAAPYQLTLGATYYDFPNLNRTSDVAEPWLSFSVGGITPFDLSLNLFAGYDFRVASGGPDEGWYYSWGVSKDFTVSLFKDAPISLALTNWGTDGVADLPSSIVYASELSLATAFDFSDFSISPSLNYVINYESGINQGKEEFWAGITVSYSY